MILTHNLIEPGRLSVTDGSGGLTHVIDDRGDFTETGELLGFHNLPFDETETVQDVFDEIASLKVDIDGLRTTLINLRVIL